MDTVTTYWMAGVVFMMFVYGGIALIGYLKNKGE